MNRIIIYGILILLANNLMAQDSLVLRGQLSVYSHLNTYNTYPVWMGGRYIPQVNNGYQIGENGLLDYEASLNINGNLGWDPNGTLTDNESLKPYRLWMRYSTLQLELRLGLQKINFGSASMLRPLMWFDQIDPRDPLKLTDGVYGFLARYYFLNNTNIWLWGLYGNKNLKGWEVMRSDNRIPEIGGRIQLPVPRGEAALSFHNRTALADNLSGLSENFGRVKENRLGIDAKFDMVIGWWVEASWSTFNKNLGYYKNQEIVNLGIDYTFGVGNGLTLTFEQLFAAMEADPFQFENNIPFSLFNLMYPVGMFDNVSAIVYYDWQNTKVYNFLNWQRQFNLFTVFIMAYANPKDYKVPTIGAEEALYTGNGLQVMLVFNH